MIDTKNLTAPIAEDFRRLTFGLFLASCLCSITLRPAAAEPSDQVSIEKVMVPMRDGVKLAATIYRPNTESKFPTLLLLRYWQTGDDEARYFAPRGYACVLVDSRGRGASEGTWDPYVNEPQDGYDAQQWIGAQSWSTGKIGTFGQSYNAFTQLMSAPLGSPYLKCLFPIEGQQTCFGHLYNDGVMQLNVVFDFGLYTTGRTAILPHIPLDSPFWRRLPLLKVVDEFPAAAPHLRRWFEHARYDDYWKSYGIDGKYDKIKVPAYFVSGWYDNLIHENWKNFNGFRQHGGTPEARNGTKILVGAATHGGAGSQFELRERWYERWLLDVDNGIDSEPPIQIFIMGANKWRHEFEWPLARTKFTNYYLASGGKANSVKGDGTLTTSNATSSSPTDQFVYDPENSVPTLGGQISTNPEVWGPKDRSPNQTRDDVLVFSSEPLEQDLEVTGPVEVKLFASSSAVDTDFTATLTDVYPDGRAIHICEGIVGATFRESREEPTPIEPGKIYEYTISLWETSNVFKAGHRLRLEVTSSNFPRYARNQNTGLPLGTSAEIRQAEQTIYHDQDHPSRLVLPIIPGS